MSARAEQLRYLRGVGEPCPVCRACSRCFAGEHWSCHGCPCGCSDGFSSVTPENGCNHQDVVTTCEYAMRTSKCEHCDGSGKVTRAVGYRHAGKVVRW